MYLQWIYVLIIYISGSHALTEHPIVIVIAFEGLGEKLFNSSRMPVLEKLAENGTYASMMSQFPSTECPNFETLSTGVYPEVHGVLGNVFFNNNFTRCLEYGDAEMYSCCRFLVPVWTLNEREHKTRYSGVISWFGSEFRKMPTYIIPPYAARFIPWKQRVNIAMEWFVSDRPINLLMMRFERIAAPFFKNKTKSLDDTWLRNVNGLMKYFLQQLEKIGIRDLVNLIILSDHGMINVDLDHPIDISQYVDPEAYECCGESPLVFVKPLEGKMDDVLKNLTIAEEKSKNAFKVYSHNEIPRKWRLKHNTRASPILLEAKIDENGTFGHVFTDVIGVTKLYGYDNDNPHMQSIFIAQGPMIRRHSRLAPFNNIHVFPLITHLLNLDRSKFKHTPNGTLNTFSRILKKIDIKRI